MPSATIRAASSSWRSGSSNPSSARAWPADSTPAATRRCTDTGSFNSRIVLVTTGRLRPSRSASSVCVTPNSASSCSYAAASSSGFSWTRWMFSSSASRSIASSPVLRTMAGSRCSPARSAARQRRSPITSSKAPSASSRTTIGCSSPNSRIECSSSASASSSNAVRGCWGLGRIAEISISR